MTQPWFRFYRAVVNSPKIQRLPAPLFKGWVNLLCCTDDEGELPSVADLAFTLRTSEREVAKLISSLIDAGLLIDTDGAVTAHDWNEHQRKSDTSNERVKRYRQRDRNGERNVTGNAPEEDTETEADTEAEKREVARAAPRAPKASRLPADWQPKQAEFALAEQLLGPRAEVTLAKFRDYWAAKAGAGGVKADWDATWRNWIRREAEDGNGRQQNHRTGTPQGRGKPAISPGWLAGAVSAIEDLQGGGVAD